MKANRYFSFSLLGLAILGMSLPALQFLTGCSSGSASGTITPAAKTAVLVNMGDAPADWMLGFTMNVTSMALNGANGSTTIVSSTTPIEMTHLMGTMQPLAMMQVPQGTYTSATITIGSANMMYIDQTSKLPTQASIAGPMTATVNFNTPVTIGSTPMSLNFDLDLGASVMSNGGTFSMNPMFTMGMGTQTATGPMDFANGGIYQMMGSVTGVSGSDFTMTSMQAGSSLTFATNGSTVFTDTSMNSMANGMMVMVDATLQPDGSLMADAVTEMGGNGGVMGGGIIAVVNGQPATSLNLIMQDGIGAGMMATFFSNGITINLNGSTSYQIDSDLVEMTGLPFTPAFDANHIYAGQSVMPISTSGMMNGGMGGGMMGGMTMAGSMTASDLELEPQSLTGTVSASITSGATTIFTLALPSDSSFTSLTGATSVQVYQQAQTMVNGTVATGTSAHVFGLLFFDNGQWKMVAARIAAVNGAA